MLEKQKKQKRIKTTGLLQGKEVTLNPSHNYRDFLSFLSRTSGSIYKTTVMIQQLECEITRLKCEIVATENEYKNLRQAADDASLFLTKNPSVSLKKSCQVSPHV